MDISDKKLILISKIFLYLLPILGVVGITVPLIIGQVNLSFLGIYLAVPLIFASIIYIKQKKHNYILTTFSKNLFILSNIFYFICVSISLYLLHAYDVRPFIYYLVIAIMSGLILLETMQFNISRKEIIIILIQLVILIENIIWGVNLKYNFYISRTDPIVHTWLIQNMITSSHVTGVFDIYESFPLWHILCTFIVKVVGLQLPTQKIMFFTNGLVYSFVPIMTYLTSAKVLKNYKVALLSALFVSIYPTIISYGMSSIPRSVVSFLEIMLLLLLLDYKNPKKRFIAIILSFSLIVYHTASMPFITSLLVMIYILEKVINADEEKPFLSSNFIILLVVMTLFYWIYYAPQLFETLVTFTLRPAPSGILTKAIIYTPLRELFNYLQYSPLLLFVIVGFLGALQSKKLSSLGKIICTTGFITVPFSFPGPALLLNKLADNLEFERFGEYTFLFIVLTGTIGFHEMYIKSKKYQKIFLIMLFISMVFLSVSNEFTASDNPLVKRPFYTPYLTANEEIAFRHVASVTQGYVMSDYATTCYLLSSQYQNNTHIQEIDGKNMAFLRSKTNDVFLIRKSELEKRPLKFYTSPNEEFRLKPTIEPHMDYYYQDFILWNDLIKYNRVYDSGSVEGSN
jgi:hypothetical protein